MTSPEHNAVAHQPNSATMRCRNYNENRVTTKGMMTPLAVEPWQAVDHIRNFLIERRWQRIPSQTMLTESASLTMESPPRLHFL
uniref:Uncharacterized protein n=1 Tax=Sphaerodactylus townsendi TaxID=933632 RepID=A0ACB8FDG7_9SAUR